LKDGWIEKTLSGFIILPNLWNPLLKLVVLWGKALMYYVLDVKVRFMLSTIFVIIGKENQSSYKEYFKNVGHFSNLITLKTTSEEAAISPLIPEKVDMVFIDGCHESAMVMKDLALWTDRAVLICGHDYEDPDNLEAHPGVKQALSEYYGLDHIDRMAKLIWVLKR